MHDDMKEVFHRLKEVELAVVEIKPKKIKNRLPLTTDRRGFSSDVGNELL